MEARAFKEEVGRYGLESTILAHSALLPEIREELGALPLFRYSPYVKPSPRTIRGPLLDFCRLGLSLRQHLQHVPTSLTTADAMLVSTLTTANELLGLALWLMQTPRRLRPRLALNFMIDNISRPLPGTNRWTIRKKKALLYRFAFRLLRRQIPAERLLLSSGGETFARTMAGILRHPVAVLPLPVQHELRHAPRSRQPCGPGPLIVVLGMMRPQKGAELVGSIIRGILARDSRCQFLLQAHPPCWEQIWRDEIGPDGAERVLIHHGEMSQDQYHAWLQSADLILMPYSPAQYVLQTSGVFSEAMAVGTPCVVPGGTWLAEMARRHGGGVTIFENQTTAAIVDATLQSLDNLPKLTASAAKISALWRETMGMQAFVKRLLVFADDGAATGNETQLPTPRWKRKRYIPSTY